MNHKFKPGDKVKCINDVETNGDLILNKIYTVAKMNSIYSDRVYLKDCNQPSNSWLTWRFELCNPKVNHLPEWM